MFYIIVSVDMCFYSSSNPFSLFWSNFYSISQETSVGWVFLDNMRTSTHFGLIVILKWFYNNMLIKISWNVNIIRLGCTFPIKYGDWYPNICLFKNRPIVASWYGRLGNIAWMEFTLDKNFIIIFLYYIVHNFGIAKFGWRVKLGDINGSSYSFLVCYKMYIVIQSNVCRK